MRQIDLSKIESRPINANWHHLEQETVAAAAGGAAATGTPGSSPARTPRSNQSRFDYLFYVDVLSSMSET